MKILDKHAFTPHWFDSPVAKIKLLLLECNPTKVITFLPVRMPQHLSDNSLNREKKQRDLGALCQLL